MPQKSPIEWTDATWNPWHGCHKVSQGCKNCYMFRDKKRYGQDPNAVKRAADKTFYAPLKWSEPRTIFTCSWSDFFIEEADPWRDEAFAIMALTPQHTYQVLTKRPDRMREYLADIHTPGRIGSIAIKLREKLNITFPNADFKCEPLGYGDPGAEWFPLPNVMLGVSVEDQKTANERIPLLLQTPAAVRFLSIEPLLAPVDLTNKDRMCGSYLEPAHVGSNLETYDRPDIDWVIVGGESGPDARPMHPDWVRSIRDQCQAAGVPFFFKQWGEWMPALREVAGDYNPGWQPQKGDYKYEFRRMGRYGRIFEPGQVQVPDYTNGDMGFWRLGKKKSGRILDGRTWDEFPEVSR